MVPRSSYIDLLERLGQATIATDLAGKIVHWGPNAETLYGWKAEEVLGRPILEVTPTDLSRSRGGEIMALLEAGQVWSGDFQVRRKDGSMLEMSVTDIPVMNEGSFSGVIGVSSPADEKVVDVVRLTTLLHGAAREIWPGRIALGQSEAARALVRSSESHLVQLFSLLVVRAVERREDPTYVHITPDPGSATAAFYPGTCVSMTAAAERPAYALLRDVRERHQPADFARTLVRLVGGELFENQETTHLFLPSSG